MTVCPVSFKTILIRGHFTKPKNRHCPFPYLQEGCLQVRKLDYKVCWVCKGKNAILQLPQSWFLFFSSIMKRKYGMIFVPIIANSLQMGAREDVWDGTRTFSFVCLCVHKTVKYLISQNRHKHKVKSISKHSHICRLGVIGHLLQKINLSRSCRDHPLEFLSSHKASQCSFAKPCYRLNYEDG